MNIVTTTAANLKVGDVLVEHHTNGAFGSDLRISVEYYEVVAIEEPDADVRRVKGATADGKIVYRLRDLGAWRRYERLLQQGRKVAAPPTRARLFAADWLVEVQA